MRAPHRAAKQLPRCRRRLGLRTLRSVAVAVAVVPIATVDTVAVTAAEVAIAAAPSPPSPCRRCRHQPTDRPTDRPATRCRRHRSLTAGRSLCQLLSHPPRVSCSRRLRRQSLRRRRLRRHRSSLPAPAAPAPTAPRRLRRRRLRRRWRLRRLRGTCGAISTPARCARCLPVQPAAAHGAASIESWPREARGTLSKPSFSLPFPFPASGRRLRRRIFFFFPVTL